MAEVKIIGKGSYGTEIHVDGIKIPGISSYTLTQKAGEMPVLHLNMLATKLDITSPVKIKEE